MTTATQETQDIQALKAWAKSAEVNLHLGKTREEDGYYQHEIEVFHGPVPAGFTNEELAQALIEADDTIRDLAQEYGTDWLIQFCDPEFEISFPFYSFNPKH